MHFQYDWHSCFHVPNIFTEWRTLRIPEKFVIPRFSYTRNCLEIQKRHFWHVGFLIEKHSKRYFSQFVLWFFKSTHRHLRYTPFIARLPTTYMKLRRKNEWWYTSLWYTDFSSEKKTKLFKTSRSPSII